MKVTREQKETKISLVISVVLLIVLLIFLLTYLIKGNDPKSTNKTINCVLENYEEVYETDSEILITAKEDKVRKIELTTVNTYTDNALLMNYNYQDEKDKIERIGDIAGITFTIEQDQKLGTVTIKGTVDYDVLVIPNQADIEPPYSNYIQKDLTTNQIVGYLTKEGYKCE